MKYPTRNGLIISPYELGYSIPTAEQLEVRKACTIHHGYWERCKYDLRYRMIFRNLVDNTFPALSAEHIRLHEKYDAPKRPRDSLMIEVLENHLAVHGVIECIKEKATRERYRIMPNEFNYIKLAYNDR